MKVITTKAMLHKGKHVDKGSKIEVEGKDLRYLLQKKFVEQEGEKSPDVRTRG